jgi:hypothetical protein
MKKLNYTILLIAMLSAFNGFSQVKHRSEQFGNTLNLGVGLGYYGYVGHSMPVLHADFEFDVVKNFTLAPFINYFSYSNYNYWGDPHNPYRNYDYRETVIPVGVKGTYYFDQIFGAGSKWDFYAAGSLGFVFRKTTWENGYYGETKVRRGTGNLYLDLHLGTEYHISKKVGLFLDISTGVSTLGLGIHV